MNTNAFCWRAQLTARGDEEVQGTLGPGNTWFSNPLGGDKVGMLTHIYPHNPPRNIEVTLCNHHSDSPFCVWPDV